MIDDLYIVARVAHHWIALAAKDIASVVKLTAVVPVPSAPPTVRGLVAIRSRIVTCLDLAEIVGDTAPDAEFMAVFALDGHAYGIALDEVDDIVRIDEFLPVPARLSAAWRDLSPRLADKDGRNLLVLDPAHIVGVAESQQRLVA